MAFHLTYPERVQLFKSLLFQSDEQKDVKKRIVDMAHLRKLSFDGIPDSGSIRAQVWKILLGYMPPDFDLWPETAQKQRNLYQEFIKELIIDPGHKSDPLADHPLSKSNSSQWNAYFKDRELLEEVDKDAKRTLPTMHFFNSDPNMGDISHYEGLKRILFIYAKLNPGIKYVQGMNEILGPIYYLFSVDPDLEARKNSEADAFFCFTNLMAEIRDNFCKTLDRSAVGIQGLMKKLNDLLCLKDPELWQNFEEKKINPQFYSFRWLTLLLSQEFDLPDVMRLWDTLFADEERFQHLLYTCCAMLILVREELLNGDFAENLKMLQKYPVQDVGVILRKAKEILSPTWNPPPIRNSNLLKPQTKPTETVSSDRPAASSSSSSSTPPMLPAHSARKPNQNSKKFANPNVEKILSSPDSFLSHAAELPVSPLLFLGEEATADPLFSSQKNKSLHFQERNPAKKSTAAPVSDEERLEKIRQERMNIWGSAEFTLPWESEEEKNLVKRAAHFQKPASSSDSTNGKQETTTSSSSSSSAPSLTSNQSAEATKPAVRDENVDPLLHFKFHPLEHLQD